MSEQNLAVDDVFEDAEDVVESHDKEPAIEHEEKPAPRGYMSKEAWIEAGRDPDDWVSPEVFKERGERIKMKADFENRLKNVQLIHQKQLEITRQELLNKRDLAIEEADKTAVRQYDKELKELDSLEEINKPDPIPDKPREILEWEQDNPWSADATDPRTAYANSVFNAELKKGKTIATALRKVDAELAAKFSTKQRPSQIAESSRSSGAGKEDSGKVTMSTLTEEEKKIWNNAGNMFKTEAAFLKAVADIRKAGKK